MRKRKALWRVRGGAAAETFSTKGEALAFARRRARKSGRAQIVVPLAPAGHPPSGGGYESGRL
jgi:hypothetical protein